MVQEGVVGNPSLSSVVPQTRESPFLPPFQAAATMPSRERFYIELKPDETTVVSWKKLRKDAQKISPSSVCEAPAGAHPALEARIAPEVGGMHKEPLPPPPNRFNSVIEKIERLYKGGHSSDENENLNDFPDDDQYDTSDSFIDDEQLNEYFAVDKSKTKHSGFFINRGKLERVIEPAILPSTSAKKRKRKDIKKLSIEFVSDDLPQDMLKLGVRMKAAARKVPLSTVGASGTSGNAQITLLRSAQRKTSKEISNGVDSRHQPISSEAGKVKVREDNDCEGKAELINTMPNNEIAHCKKDLHCQDASECRETTKNVVSERLKGGLSSACASKLLVAVKKFETNFLRKKSTSHFDSQVKDPTKEAGAASMSKMKVAQKGTRDGDIKERDNGGCKLQSENLKYLPQKGKEVSPGRLKGTMLERSIQDLERGVAEFYPLSMDVREQELAVLSGGKSKRLCRDVKQKLAKVARLAQAKQGRISDELIERLMGILGHVMREKTLKRNLKEMIEMGLSAMQEKEGRLQDIKREVTEMVKSRVSSLKVQDVEQRDGSSDEFQAIPGSGEKRSGRYQWDYATEDRICDLYEQYIEGMDEHRGPKIRKLYAELAELWPEGLMDSIGIKHAVHRAKERKKRLNRLVNGGAKKETEN